MLRRKVKTGKPYVYMRTPENLVVVRILYLRFYNERSTTLNTNYSKHAAKRYVNKYAMMGFIGNLCFSLAGKNDEKKHCTQLDRSQHPMALIDFVLFG